MPRYLFRAFTAASGGGQHLAINNEHEMVPHGLMDGKKLDFYSRSEAELWTLAMSHLSGCTEPLTMCTSWAASLFSVLYYATYLSQNQDPWVAVIDTHLLQDVLVFNAADLVNMRELEYQAYGHIQGKGYQAVRFRAMVDAGLDSTRCSQNSGFGCLRPLHYARTAGAWKCLESISGKSCSPLARRQRS